MIVVLIFLMVLLLTIGRLLIVIALIPYSFSGFSLSEFGDDQFRNFDIFKKKVFELAEKDEEIKKYLLVCKNRVNSHAANIHGGDVDRKTDS